MRKLATLPPVSKVTKSPVILRYSLFAPRYRVQKVNVLWEGKEVRGSRGLVLAESRQLPRLSETEKPISRKGETAASSVRHVSTALKTTKRSHSP